MTKIVGVTTVWKRPKITELCLKHNQQVQKHSNIDLELIAVGSEGDTSKKMCEKYGFEYIEFPNSPLIQKTQAGILAAKKYNPDAVLRLDSDDLISLNYPEALYNAMVENELDITGFYDLYLFSVGANEMIHWVDKKKRPNGAGMMISRRALDVHDFSVFPEDSILEFGQDRALHQYLVPEGMKSRGFLLKDVGVSTISIKSRTNLWNYSGFKDPLESTKLDPLETVSKICESFW